MSDKNTFRALGLPPELAENLDEDVRTPQDDLAAQLADGDTILAVDGKLVAQVPEGGGGGGTLFHFKDTRGSSGQVFLMDCPVPAGTVAKVRFRWNSVPNGASVVVSAAKYNGSAFANGYIQGQTSGAAGSTEATGTVTFADGDRLAVTTDEDACGNAATGSKLDILVEFVPAA
jgi:hypothetical protein